MNTLPNPPALTTSERVSILERKFDSQHSEDIVNRIIDFISFISALAYSAYRVGQIAVTSPDVTYSSDLLMFFNTDAFEYLVLGSLWGWTFFYSFIVALILRFLYSMFRFIKAAIYE